MNFLIIQALSFKHPAFLPLHNYQKRQKAYLRIVSGCQSLRQVRTLARCLYKKGQSVRRRTLCPVKA